MRVRLRNEDGFLLIELIAAMVIITVALLALLGAYDEMTFSLRSGAKDSSASLIGNNQLELFASLPYANLGWYSASTVTSAESSFPDYSTDDAALHALDSGSDYFPSSPVCTASSTLAQCKPVQSVTGSDGKQYELETFIRSVNNANGHSRSELVVTVIVRDLSASGDPKEFVGQTAFDSGP